MMTKTRMRARAFSGWSSSTERAECVGEMNE